MELAAEFPQLQLVIEDTKPVIDQGRSVWTSEMPQALQMGRVILQVHDFFREQPIKGADVYFLRYIL